MRPSSPKPLFLWALRSFSRGISRWFRGWPVAVRLVATPKLKAGRRRARIRRWPESIFRLWWVMTRIKQPACLAHKAASHRWWWTRQIGLIDKSSAARRAKDHHHQPICRSPFERHWLPCFSTWCRKESCFWNCPLKIHTVAAETELSEKS